MKATLQKHLQSALEAKRERRARLARLSFDEKIDIIERLREDLAPFRRARQSRNKRDKA